MPDPLVVCSTFSGVGGMDRGLELAGMRVAMSCEFEPVRRRILRRHWPHVPCCPDIRLLGDACDTPTIDEDPESPTYGQTFIRDGSHHPGPIDMLCGGFPCQDVSVAGQRRGLAGRRTGLFFEFARCADELVRPGGLILLENVPGLLSSHGGRDFAVILATLAELGFHDVAWRVLDSRHFGVPQRRRRVFILGRRARGRFCASVLLELDGRVGDPAAGREAWAAASGSSRRGVAGARGGRPGRAYDAPDIAATLSSGSHASHAPGRRKEDDSNLVAPVTAKWAKHSGGPAGDECQNLVGGVTARYGKGPDSDATDAFVVDERSVSQRIDDGDLTQALTRRFGNSGPDLPDAEGNWLVPATAGPVLTGSGGGRTTDIDGGAYPVRGPEPGAGPGDPDAAERADRDAAREHAGRQERQDPDDVREAARREHGGRSRDMGARRDRSGAELDGPSGDERGAGAEPESARLRARHERGARESAAPADGVGDGDGAPADADRVRAAAGLRGRVDDPVRPELGVDPPPVSCVHTDAVGYDGICKTDSVDAVGVSRKRDAGLGVTDDGTAYSLKTGAPHVIGPVEVYDQQNARVVEDVGTLTSGLEHGNRGFVIAEQRRAYTVQTPSTTKQMRDALEASETDTAGALTASGPARRSDRGTLIEEPTMFDASSQHGREGVGTGMPNMAPAGESLALTSRADRYAVFGGEPVDDLPTSPYDPQPDGPRYAAMGDAVTVNVLHWIGAKIVAEAEAHGGLHEVPTT